MHLRAAALALLFLATAGTLAAFEKGGTVYSKRNETSLLADPNPLAKATAKAEFAEAFKIQEVRGNWLRVKSKKSEGWVFAGNVSDDKPKRAPSAGLTTVSASETNTAAAARPLAPAAEGFAERHDAGEAKADVEWLDATSATLPNEQIVAYLRENKKGEYQP